MRKKLEDERLKLAAKHESDKLREAEKLSARKKQMAREASLARQHEIQTRIKRIAEEKQKIQLQLIEDLREKANASKHAASVQGNSDSSKAPLKKKKVLPKLKSSKAMSPHANIYGNSSASKQQELKSKRSKKPGKNPAPQKLPKLKSMSSKTPISESSRANSWKTAAHWPTTTSRRSPLSIWCCVSVVVCRSSSRLSPARRSLSTSRLLTPSRT